MFKSVKKAISSIFGARVVAKPRRNVIALPVDTAAESEAALVDARRGLLAVLEEILQGKKDAEEEAIDNLLDALHEGFCESDYNAEALQWYLAQLGLVAPDWDYDDARWGALAAAIEYFAGCFPVDVQTLTHALKVIESGNYRHIAESEYDFDFGFGFAVEDDEALGRFIATKKIAVNAEGFEYLEGYFDFEACGRDYRTATNGKFTTYGFFAEF